MVNVTINGKDIRVKRGTTILEAAEKAGYRIPRLCFLKKINEIGACRVCLVEIEASTGWWPPATMWWRRGCAFPPTVPVCRTPEG